MGKAVDEQQSLPSTALDAQGSNPDARNCNECCLSCCRLKKVVTVRCILVFVLGVAVLLSAVFWLPFFHFGEKKNLDLDYGGYDIVASFMLKKPASFLKDYILQLQDDIFDEMSFSTTKNLYVRLTNLKGSSVAPPTIVQSEVLLAVGINPSQSRLKQLAQTITSSHAKNLGLNNTVFGRVKQVRLSSILQHSLGSDGSGPSPSPSPSPLPPSHHHHHHYHHEASFAPIISPSPAVGSGSVIGKGSPNSTPAPARAPAPAPVKNKAAEPPACHSSYNNRSPWKHNEHSHLTPSSPPVYAPHAAPSQPKQTDPVTPKMSPVSAASPSPNVAYVHRLPPSKGEFHARPPDAMPLVSASQSPSSAAIFFSNTWAILLFTFHVLYM